MAVQAGLSLTWLETQKPGFLVAWLIYNFLVNVSNIGILTVPRYGSRRPIPAHMLMFGFLLNLSSFMC